MLSYADVTPSRVSYSKNMITDQTTTGLIVRLGSASTAMSPTLGWGVATPLSTITLVAAAGWNDQQMTVVMSYTNATIQGYEELGALVRFQSNELNADTSFYYARIRFGEAQICKIIATTFTVLSEHSFPLPPNTNATIIFRAEGNAISANFSATGLTTVDLSVVDSSIPTGGFMGFRTGPIATSGYCSSFTAEQI